jgi:hypothetical protein
MPRPSRGVAKRERRSPCGLRRMINNEQRHLQLVTLLSIQTHVVGFSLIIDVILRMATVYCANYHRHCLTMRKNATLLSRHRLSFVPHVIPDESLVNATAYRSVERKKERRFLSARFSLLLALVVFLCLSQRRCWPSKIN